MIIIKMFVLIGFFSLSRSRNRFMPNLPMGEYRVVFDKLYSCEPTENHSIQFYIYFSKKSLSIVELKGNVTTLIPFGDNIIGDVNIASWGSTGGWKPNSIIHVTKKACSTLKTVVGNAWVTFQKAFHVPTDTCPIPKGTYISSGMDMNKLIEGHNFPKVYFYGKYKATFKFKNVENQLLGCGVLEFSLIRPWETPI
ncbi:uncharacterized protein LOC132945157 [Metopolophium dirhodum]|uniref:uncharacterized protein LOC132945157 n=1 Tax=Metopolophium dirhodum TaxID=44670 RepID=UPI00298FB576|nr:uncharacterized protein LOC132945157 [Metopolophium dirhodum]